jgi:hypothetical protein
MKTIKKFGLLVSVVMASAVLARAEQGKNSALNSLNEMAGGVTIEAQPSLAGVAVGAAVISEERAGASRSYSKRTVNDDGSISIADPFFMLGGERFAIDYYNSTNSGLCKLYGLGSARFSDRNLLSGHSSAVIINDQGKASGLNTPSLASYKIIVCEAR